jgi:hypothetical protein
MVVLSAEYHRRVLLGDCLAHDFLLSIGAGRTS